jgi:hypothetical protein
MGVSRRYALVSCFNISWSRCQRVICPSGREFFQVTLWSGWKFEDEVIPPQSGRQTYTQITDFSPLMFTVPGLLSHAWMVTTLGGHLEPLSRATSSVRPEHNYAPSQETLILLWVQFLSSWKTKLWWSDILSPTAANFHVVFVSFIPV